MRPRMEQEGKMCGGVVHQTRGRRREAEVCNIGAAHGTCWEEHGEAVHGTGEQCADVRLGAEHETSGSTERGKRVRQREAHTK